jgi:L-ascorbate metabolism protein UlaG (beta-lactamase superfamily)
LGFMKKKLARLMVVAAMVLGVLVALGWAYLQLPKFGALAAGPRLARVQQSPHYRDGKFQNLSPTPDLTEGVSYYAVLKEFLFEQRERGVPAGPLPSQKTDLHALPPDQDVLVWLGHSSYYMQVDGKRILVDPVLSGGASPVPFTTRSFAGTDVYGPADFPSIDFLFISHDHWDHLDHPTIVALRPKLGLVVCGLGVGQHLERWGFAPAQVREHDWHERLELAPGWEVHTVPGRHFSGRGLARNQSLWLAYALRTPRFNLFLGGDSGYDAHFAEAGQKYGPFDLAILECGQYDKSWKYIHLMPEETVQACIDLRAKRLLPVHWGKFQLGNHAWDEPIVRVVAAAQARQVPLLAPMIGQAVPLADSVRLDPWWEGIK